MTSTCDRSGCGTSTLSGPAPNCRPGTADRRAAATRHEIELHEQTSGSPDAGTTSGGPVSLLVHGSAGSARTSEPVSPPRDDYQHLAPLLERFAQLDKDDPGRPALRAQLARGYRPMVSNIARRYRNRGEPSEDLEQVGTLGLLQAIERFDPQWGSTFVAFAVPTITGEIRRHFRDHTWAVHVPRRIKEVQTVIDRAQETLSTELRRAPRVSELAAHLNLSRGDVIEALTARESYRVAALDRPFADSASGIADLVGAPDIRFDLVDARRSLRPAVQALPERDRLILTLRFFEDLTQTEIANRVGLSQMHISRILTRTLAALRDHVVVG